MSRIGERRKRAAIVEAAVRVFQHSGYERASMNDVATQAGAVEAMMAAGIAAGEFKPGPGTPPDDVAAVFVEIFLHGLVREPGPPQ